MTRISTQRASRQATSEYAVSQRFLDAIRSGFSEVGKQKAQLSTARDIAQHLHVQKLDEHDLDNTRRFKQSVDHAVKAWRSATQIYAEIFESLAKATEADPSGSRSDRRGHTVFAEIARTASEAKRNANNFVLFEELRMADEETTPVEQNEASQEDDVEDDESSEEESAPMDSTSTKPTLHHLSRGLPPGQPVQEPKSVMNTIRDKSKSDSERHKILLQKGGVKSSTAYGTLGSSEKKAWKADERKRRREKKQAKRAAQRQATQELDDAGRDKANSSTEDTSNRGYEAAQATLHGTVPPSSMPVSTSINHVVPVVQYEDVSAEVDARLKAKQLKKEAAKAEKKRKRESGDSFQGREVDEKGEHPKKRKKKVIAEEGAKSVDLAARKHELEDAEPIESETRRKRMKSTA